MFIPHGLVLAVCLAAVSANEIFQHQQTKSNKNDKTEKAEGVMEMGDVNVLKTRGFSIDAGTEWTNDGTSFGTGNFNFGGLNFGPSNLKSSSLSFNEYSVEVRGENVGQLTFNNGQVTYKNRNICVKPLLKEKTFRKKEDGTYWYTNCNVGNPMTAKDIDHFLEILRKEEKELEETAKQHEKSYKERRALREKENAEKVKEMEKQLIEKEHNKKLRLEQREKEWAQKLKQMEQNLVEKKKLWEEREKQKLLDFEKRKEEWAKQDKKNGS